MCCAVGVRVEVLAGLTPSSALHILNSCHKVVDSYYMSSHIVCGVQCFPWVALEEERFRLYNTCVPCMTSVPRCVVQLVCAWRSNP